MDHRPLGRTGVRVSSLCLGAMMFGAFGNPDHDDAVRIIHRALDAGVNFIDTADFYSAGESEEIVGKALAGGRRDDVVLATKAGLPFGDRRQRPRRLAALDHHRRRGLAAAAAGPTTSTSSRSTDSIRTPTSTRRSACLSDLVHAGKIRMFGASTVSGAELVEAQWAAERRGRERFRTEQPIYNMLTRAAEYDVLPRPRATAWAC